MQNTQKNILIIIGVIIIGGGIWYFASDSEPTRETETSATKQREVSDSQPEEKLSGFGSLGAILGFGDNVRCEFKTSYEGQTSEGTLVTDGERFRMESTLEDPISGVMTSNIINDGTHTYTWGKSPQGEMAIKMANPEVEEGDSFDYDETMPNDDSYVDFEQEVEYDCDRWRVDDSAFVPPDDVDFMSMEDMMREAMQGMPEGFEMPEGISTY